MQKDVYSIAPVGEYEGEKYALLITRSVSPFDGPKHVVFYVDGLRASGDGECTWYEAYKGSPYGEVITAFPMGSMFILVPAERLVSQTSLEYQLAEKEKEKILTDALKTDEPDKTELPLPGQYA